MPSNEENPPKTYSEETLEDEEEEEEEDLNSYSPSTSSDDPNKYSNTLAVAASPVSAVPNSGSTVSNGASTVPTAIVAVPASSAQPVVSKASLFQRLWTDADEIGLLQGFLDYTNQRGGSVNSSYHLDTASFYDQIKNRLQLDFNKNQLVEKLRRLKKKYRNALNRMSNGKDFTFKSPHDQQAFEISHKIWSGIGTGAAAVGAGRAEEIGVDEEEQKPKVITIGENNNGCVNDIGGGGGNSLEKKEKVLRPKKRAREDGLGNLESSSMSNVIEDTVKSCLSPLFKELFYHAINGGSSNSGGLGLGLGGGLGLNPLQLGFGIGIGASSSMNSGAGETMDEKWKKQRILELEVYSKRIELVQDEIKAKLEELKSNGS